MTRKELIEIIKSDGGNKKEIQGVLFKIMKDEEENPAIEATVDGINFRLWGHYEKVNDFYTDSLSLKNASKVLTALRKLAVAVNIQLAEEFGDTIEKIVEKEDTEKIREIREETAKAKGALEVYEKIFGDHNRINLTK